LPERKEYVLCSALARKKNRLLRTGRTECFGVFMPSRKEYREVPRPDMKEY
jgi:hypothetical protein